MNMKFISTILILCYCVHALETLELTKWTLFSSDGKIIIQNISSPVDSFSALLQNSDIDWPWKGFNDIKYRWIALQNFSFQSLPFSATPSESYALSVSGLDVGPSIFLNGKYIGTTQSEFISEDFIINSTFVFRSNNILTIHFISSLILANETARWNGYKVPPDCWPKEFNGDCHINVIRKTQASFGWDWGPSLAAVGIRGKIKFTSANPTTGKIKFIKILTKTNADCSNWSAEVVINAFVLLAETQAQVCIMNKITDLKSKYQKCLNVLKSGLVEFRFLVNLNNQNLKLWWPHDLGTPALYEMETHVLHLNKVLDHKIQYVGFRSVSLNQTTLPNNQGRYFGFTINCKPVFIKGTNWIPRTYLTQDWNNKTFVEFLMNSVVTANMNSIRLWGGGKPETEHFYRLADRLGLMIWHDLMFACVLYPYSDHFLSTVQKEVTEIVNHLQIHPSILLWSGNNEIEALIAQGWYNTTPMDPGNIKRYQHLFGEVIKTIVKSEDPYGIFILSSPSNGVESEKSQGVSKNPQSQIFGDVHFYLYSGDIWNWSLYPVTRMTTEFGFQSLPQKDTWGFTVQSERDYEIDGILMRHLQHHPDGNRQLIDAVRFYFGKLYPKDAILPVNKYKWFSYLTQINQAVILRNYIERLLSSQCTLSSEGLGLTRGVMYWQLNDNWIAPTWSTIDWLGHWKLGHYFVRTAFSPEKIIIKNDKGFINLILILKDEFVRKQYTIILRSLNISQKIQSSILNEEIMSYDTVRMKCNVETIFTMGLSEFIQSFKCSNIKSCLFEVILKRNQSILSVDTLMLVYPLRLELPPKVAANKVSVKIHRDDLDFSICLLSLQSEYINLFVTLTTSSWGTFSDNGFHMINNYMSIYFYPWQAGKNNFFNCSTLAVEIFSLNELYL